MTQLIEITAENLSQIAPLWNTPHNQLRRKVGRFSVVYCGGVDGGTVRDAKGQCWDWWMNGSSVVVVEAK